VRITKLVLVIALTTLTLGIVAGPAVAGQPSIPQLKKQLRHAKKMRQRTAERAGRAAAGLAAARAIRAAADAGGDAGTDAGTAAGEPVPDPATTAAPDAGLSPALAAVLLADGVVTEEEVATLQKRAVKTRKLARRWALKARSLQRRVRHRVQIKRWNRQGRWKPLIKLAGKKYGVSTAGLHRMMMLESGGRRTVGSMYKGLYQYHPATWAGRWNPWRRHSIYDGWAQIRATAYALSKGMGRSQWPNTYPMAF